MSVLNKLTEGIVNRDLRQEGAALLNKWEKTGLLEGLEVEHMRHGMARLLENQAKQLLKEASVMAASGGGDVQGFSAVAFPLVRRVFAGLFANDLVSVQPMSLPAGLIFFLDFTTSTDGPGLPRLGYGLDGAASEESLYGGGRIGSQITGGVLLTAGNAESGPYALNNGYSSPTASFAITSDAGTTSKAITPVGSGSISTAGAFTFLADVRLDTVAASPTQPGGVVGAGLLRAKTLKFDPDLPLGGTFCVGRFEKSILESTNIDLDNFVAIAATGTFSADGLGGGRLIRRLTQLDPDDATKVLVVLASTGSESVTDLSSSMLGLNQLVGAVADTVANATPIGAVNATEFLLESNTFIPEIDIKVDSIAVTAQTKKLKAKWTPELGQDLNAYHNLDAEVELTSILSEQIALEIDHEILSDLINGATAGTFYWSRSPGLFVRRDTGAEVGATTAAPDFTGTVSEWYETLVETINDVSAQIHRKTLRGGANFIVCGPEVANILEFTAGFRASVTADVERGSIGAVKVGQLTKKFDVYVDPYFPRPVILVGRRGGSFLESGYVYAPYVPLQVTPTIFGVEDFVPRKGVMTRYAKKMVRPDMYGLVICRGLLGESGGS